VWLPVCAPGGGLVNTGSRNSGLLDLLGSTGGGGGAVPLAAGLAAAAAQRRVRGAAEADAVAHVALTAARGLLHHPHASSSSSSSSSAYPAYPASTSSALAGPACGHTVFIVRVRHDTGGASTAPSVPALPPTSRLYLVLLTCPALIGAGAAAATAAAAASMAAEGEGVAAVQAASRAAGDALSAVMHLWRAAAGAGEASEAGPAAAAALPGLARRHPLTALLSDAFEPPVAGRQQLQAPPLPLPYLLLHVQLPRALPYESGDADAVAFLAAAHVSVGENRVGVSRASTAC
jgi:hypothetical protein